MKKLLSIVLALATALSLVAGVGARSASAAVTLSVTPSGNFVGGANGTRSVDAAGIVISITDGTHAVVDVTTASAGTFAATPNVLVLRGTAATSTDPHWAVSGDQSITFSGGYTFVPGDNISVAAATRNGVGTIISCNTPTTLAQVHVTTAAVGTIGPVVRKAVGTTSSIDPTWGIAGNHPVVFATTDGLKALDVLDVSMVQAVPAVPAVAFLMFAGAVTAGNVAEVTWQDTSGASHTASYTAVTGDTLATVATRLKGTINDVVAGNVIATNAGASVLMLTQRVAGAAGNGRTLTTGTTAIAARLTVRTLGGLASPVLVEKGKTVQLVAADPTGTIVTAAWMSSLPAVATVNAGGLVTAIGGSRVLLVTASFGMYTGSFVVIPISPQTITRLAVKLVPARLKVAGRQQFGAIGASKAYGSLDYTTQATWTDTLRVGAISNIAPIHGLLTYRTAETGKVSAHVDGITATVAINIDAAGAVTIVKVPVVPVVPKTVIVLTIGSGMVTIDGHAAILDAAPEIVAGRTFVPMRFIAETFGSTVKWLPLSRSITITLGTTTIILQIGNATGIISGRIISLDAAPYVKNSRTMVPLRVISESFGSDVAWNAARHVITITYVLP
ncbi:MAG: copper amine oxidase N-terminal domain-containing protein [Candidatus Cryosericum sp.]